MKYKCFVACLMVFAFYRATAQQDKLLIRIKDAVTDLPLHNAIITNSRGMLLSKSDSVGYCSVALNDMQAGKYLLAMHPGYTPDTIRSAGAVIYLHPLAVTMNAAVVSASKVGRLLREPDEYVVDYIFAGGQIL